MSKRSLAVLLVVGFFVASGATFSGDRADAQGDQALHIDVPVKLEKANVVHGLPSDLLPNIAVEATLADKAGE